MSSTRCTNNPEVNTSTITRDCDENITAPDRRDFLKKLGKYAVVTPPVVASLIHLQDFIQETTSLSSRFGLHLTFMKPSQDDYFEMIIKMLEYENISFNREEIEIEAKRWALRHRGMSGRVAMQFVKHLKMLSD